MPGRAAAAALAALVAAAAVAPGADAVDRSKFRKCEHTSFCRDHRPLRAGAASPARNALVVDSLRVDAGAARVTGEIQTGVEGEDTLTLEVQLLAGGRAARVRINEHRNRWQNGDVVLPNLALCGEVSVQQRDAGSTLVLCGGTPVVALEHAPLVVHLLDPAGGNTPVVSANARNRLYFEQSQTDAGLVLEADDGTEKDTRTIIDWGEDGKPIYAADDDGGDDEDEDEDEDVDEDADAADEDDAGASDGGGKDTPLAEWTESFGGHTDHRPHGPQSVGMDVTFPVAREVYGIPEHATRLALKPTTGSGGDKAQAYDEPYRLYNLDVFEYELDEPMALCVVLGYGAIPFMVGHGLTADGAAQTAGAFWHNPSETFIDVERAGAAGEAGQHSYWMSEAGTVDLFLFAGPGATDVVEQYTRVTGTTQLPPMFAIAYHQCRWNYKNEEDVFSVDAMFEELDFPYDVLWLDIEHTDGKRYFTWDKNEFPNPKQMIERIAEKGRKMVTIVDPHIKRDSNYHVHREATEKGLYIKDKTGKDFDGWCWPGSSSYLDFTTEHVREWWAGMFAYDTYQGSTPDLYTWNDMNEPSVFNGPEVSMHKQSLNLQGVEHREWHNLYGMYFHNATQMGHVARNGAGNEKRPFVLTRSYFAGSQRVGAMWTGDNAAEWSHLEIATPMLLTQGIAGFAFSGADVGGFFGNPSAELLTRWYQVGAFQPFFRAHAHIDTKRREPWLFGEEVLRNLRAAVVTRYQLLPFLYTLFAEASQRGLPVNRPMWMHYSTDAATFAMDDQFLVGSDLLVKAVAAEGQTSTDVYFPADTVWFPFPDAHKPPVAAPRGGGVVRIPSPIDTIPAFQRAGSIVPLKQRVRRCSALMRADPLTLRVALDPATGAAEGAVYIDDEESFAYAAGPSGYALRSLRAETTPGQRLVISNRASAARGEGKGGTFESEVAVERVTVMGVASKPTSVSVADGAQLTFYHDAATGVLTVRKPAVGITADWDIVVAL